MDLSGKIAGAVTPTKNPQTNRSKNPEIYKDSENSNPNLKSPGLKFANSPGKINKSATKTQKSASKNPNSVTSPPVRNKIRERKFVVAKRNLKREKENSSTVTCKCKAKVGFSNSQKCLCVAYESLRASQEEFFKNRFDSDQLKNCERDENGVEEQEGERISPLIETLGFENGYEMKSGDFENPDEIEQLGEMGSSNIKRRRDKLLEEARESVPEPGSGRVMHLVKAFERLLTIPKSKDSDQTEENESEDEKKGLKWALPGLQSKAAETQVSSSSFCPSDFFLTSENLGLDSRVSSSLDSNHGSFTFSSRTSGGGGGGRNRRNSSGSSGTFCGNRWKKRQVKATNLKPFKLRTEQRGRNKEEEFMKKVQQMMEEEEKQRIPIAQGLPWTTDEPECLVKPPVKECTRPIDLVLHSDVRAVDRSEFDQQMAEKMSIIEQYREERERLQKLAEEEEIRRLRKELVPRAQPMPYFDRPFIPRRSMKHPTIPREPKFHIPQHKKIKCCMSWNDMCIHTNNEMQ